MKEMLVVALVLAASAVAAQETKPFEPALHQPGKDVQWVPTPPALVEKCSTWPT